MSYISTTWIDSMRLLAYCDMFGIDMTLEEIV